MEVEVNSSLSEIDLGLPNEEFDIAYQWIKREPLKLKNWLWYIESKKGKVPVESLYPVYAKAVEFLPGSYKLWYEYLKVQCSYFFKDVDITNTENKEFPVSTVRLSDPRWEEVNKLFEQSLYMCHTFPVIWQLYCSFMSCQRKITRSRHLFDRALRHLPVTQHEKIWPLYLKFAEQTGGNTLIAVWRRYVRMEPEQAEKYVEVLMRQDPCLVSEAVCTLIYISEDPKNRSLSANNKHYYWVEMSEIICKHAEEAKDLLVGWTDPFPASKLSNRSLDIEKSIRTCIDNYGDNVSQLWNALARMYISRGLFDMGSDIYNESICTAKTLNDFSILFDAYATYEERRLENLMERLNLGEDDVDVNEVYIDMKLMKLENLMERRHILVNNVLLRQNPNNVSEWIRRVNIYKEDNNDKMVSETYEQAIATINPKKCDGKLYMIYTNYAEYLLEKKGIEACRDIFEKAVQVPYKRINDLFELWKKYIQLEIKHKNIDRALELADRTIAPPSKAGDLKKIQLSDTKIDTHRRLFKYTKMWEYCLDLYESLSTLEFTKAMYERAIELRACTPQMIINYAILLEDNKYYQESYRVYERGIQFFGYPVAYEILNVYIPKFTARYGSTKIERVRELFEHALDKCPSKFAKPLYLMYAKYEEDCGFIRHSMRIYERALEQVDKKDLLVLYKVYINKVITHYGIPYTREIYQKAIETLPDKHAVQMSIQFAESEASLGEADRARAIYAYTSQISNPKLYPEFWKSWYNFEVKDGNEDTFKEMLRIQRSVATKYNTEAGYLSLYIKSAEDLANSQK